MYVFANRYKYIDLLGRGTSGKVIRAFDQKTKTYCAVKILNSLTNKRVSSVALEGFQEEFEILKNLNHPHIAKVLDAGFDYDPDYAKEEDDDTAKEFYIATELVDGDDLYEETENATPEEIEKLFVQALRALSYLHEKKIYHLDIKPQNIIVTKDTNNKPLLKLIDFGFANFYERQRKKRKSQDAQSIIAGTSPFVAPEIILGEEHGPTTDLYSLGCTFHKIYSRFQPFSGESDYEFHQKHLYEKPKPPSLKRPDTPAYMDTIILKMLEKKPEDRFQSASEIIKQINLEGQKSYAIETLQTSMSYLPEKGEMVGRKEQFEQFLRFYNDRFEYESFEKKPYVVVMGDKGLGKTRFLNECKNRAQKDFTKIFSWPEFLSYEMTEDVPLPCLVLADESDLTKFNLDYMDAFFSDQRAMAIFTATTTDLDIARECIIKLEPFNKEQTKEYLSIATGIENVPESIVETIFKRTMGVPLYVTEYLKSLFNQGFFKDAQGKWSPLAIKDLRLKFANKEATLFIKKNLIEKIKNLSLGEAHKNILYLMALIGRPGLEKTEQPTEGKIQSLIDLGFIQQNEKAKLEFTNPLLREALLENIPDETLTTLCRLIVRKLQEEKVDHTHILYFKGRAQEKNSAATLLQLAQSKHEQNDFEAAKENLIFLLEKTKPAPSIKIDALLSLSKVYWDTGEFDKVIESTKQVLQLENEASPLDKARANELLGLAHQNLNQNDAALDAYQKGLKLIEANKEALWLEVLIKSRLAMVFYGKGEVKKASEFLEETWQVWQNKLTEEEKLKTIPNQISTIYLLKGENQKAIDCLEKQLAVLHKVKHRSVYPLTLFSLAKVHVKMGNIKLAQVILHDCLKLMKSHKSVHWLYAVYNELGNIKEGSGEFYKALDYYQHAFDLAQKTKGTIHSNIMAHNVARIYLSISDYPAAKNYYQLVISNFQKEPDQNNPTNLQTIYSCYLGLIEVALNQKDFEHAKVLLEKSYELLSQHKTLSYFEQYFWQSAVEVYELVGDQSKTKEAWNQIEKLKEKPSFQANQFKRWLDGRKETDSG